MPKRIQRRRTKGWRMPANTVYVGRPTKWGNPFSAADYSRHDLTVLFRQALVGGQELYPSTEEIRRELRGKDLACWCSLNEPCHADVLLEIANSTPEYAIRRRAGGE